ncbi:MAG: glycosyltransferase family 4 protein [Sulfurimonas sp.]|nr:glycosyltransferase family 4 protein [Sulfurimonas sp.]
MIYLLLLCLSFVLTYFIKNYALKKSLVAEVTDRSSHSVATPHGGGIAIAVTWFIGLFYLYLIDSIDRTLFFTLLVGILISVVSYFDDLFELSAKLRLGVQATVATVGLYLLGGVSELDFFFFTIQNQLFTNIFSFFLIIWFINLYNFLDGINGYAGSETLFLSLAGFILFGGDHFLVLAVAVLGFLYWNFGEAKIFMGDVGSTLLGYNIAIFTLYYTNQNIEDFWIWIILFGLFLFDATWTLFRRFKNKEKLSKAHKKHAYQRATQAGYSHTKVAVIAMSINMFSFLMIYFISNIFVILLITLIVLYAITKLVDLKKGFY